MNYAQGEGPRFPMVECLTGSRHVYLALRGQLLALVALSLFKIPKQQISPPYLVLESRLSQMVLNNV